MLYHNVLHCTVLYCTALYSAVRYGAVRCFSAVLCDLWCCLVLRCCVVWCGMVRCVVLYFTTLFRNAWLYLDYHSLNLTHCSPVYRTLPHPTLSYPKSSQPTLPYSYPRASRARLQENSKLLYECNELRRGNKVLERSLEVRCEGCFLY